MPQLEQDRSCKATFEGSTPSGASMKIMHFNYGKAYILQVWYDVGGIKSEAYIDISPSMSNISILSHYYERDAML